MTRIYVIGSTGHIGRYKIGISKNVGNRKKEISKAIKSDAYVIFSCPLLFAYVWEQLLHLVYSPLNCKSMQGSGRTEWFYMIAPITPIIFICFFFCLEIAAIVTLVLTVTKFNQVQNQYQKSSEKKSVVKSVKHRTR